MFTKGYTPWNKGEKIELNPNSLANLRPGWKVKPWLGKKRPDLWAGSRPEAREWMLGNPGNTKSAGESHYRWAGDHIKYRGLHRWVEKVLGKPNMCEFCSKIKERPRQIQWANLTGDYKREITDWISLCIPCHKQYDGMRRKMMS